MTTFKVPRGSLFSTEEVVAILAQAIDAVKEGRKVVIVLVDPKPVQLDD